LVIKNIKSFEELSDNLRELEQRVKDLESDIKSIISIKNRFEKFS